MCPQRTIKAVVRGTRTQSYCKFLCTKSIPFAQIHKKSSAGYVVIYFLIIDCLKILVEKTLLLDSKVPCRTEPAIHI